MATNSSIRGIANLGKRFLTPTRSLSVPLARRSLHTSSYDKNVDDHVHSAVVPDDIVQPQSDKYWGPNPNTGVFGPASEQNPGGERGFHTSPANGNNESVLEQKAFFRPLEDLEKPQHP